MKPGKKTYQRRGAEARLAARLRDVRGFMLAEQLVSVIFIGLLCVVVAAGLGAAMSAYGNITKQARASALLSQAVELVSEQLVYARDVEDVETQTEGNILKFTSPTSHSRAELKSDASGILLKADHAQEILVPTKDGLVPSLASLEYGADGAWTFHITVRSMDPGSTLLAETTMTVQRIGS